MYEEGTFKSNG